MTDSASTSSTEKIDDSFSMRVFLKGLKMKFPKVENVSTQTLYDWRFKRDDSAKCLILDTRPEEEYVVSHLEQAVRVHPDAQDVEQTKRRILEEYKEENTRVVCYCSVGYRSSKYADLLTKALRKESSSSNVTVYNLEGSLFKWANEDKPMIDNNGKPTTFVHPYNKVFGKLLQSSKWKYVPESDPKL